MAKKHKSTFLLNHILKAATSSKHKPKSQN